MPCNKMSSIFQDLKKALNSNHRLLAVLIDPEKTDPLRLPKLLEQIKQTAVTHILVGGSTDRSKMTEQTVHMIQSEIDLPILLFPGHYEHLTDAADALLFLSLISGRNPEYLIEQQVKAVEVLKNSSIELISTGYILIDGGKMTAVAEISKTRPLDQNNVQHIVHTALAGQYLGHKLLYLEAGSGAKFPVRPRVISAVKEAVEVPLIVGGGIRNHEQLTAAYKAGADMVVIGTAFEEDDHFFKQLKL